MLVYIYKYMFYEWLNKRKNLLLTGTQYSLIMMQMADRHSSTNVLLIT